MAKKTKKSVGKKPAKTPTTKKTSKSRKPKSKIVILGVQETVQQPVQNDSVVNFWKDFEKQLNQPMEKYDQYDSGKKFPTNYSNVDFHGHFKPLYVAPTKKEESFSKKFDKKMSQFIDNSVMYAFDHPFTTSIALTCLAAIAVFGGMILWNKFH